MQGNCKYKDLKENSKLLQVFHSPQSVQMTVSASEMNINDTNMTDWSARLVQEWIDHMMPIYFKQKREAAQAVDQNMMMRRPSITEEAPATTTHTTMEQVQAEAAKSAAKQEAESKQQQANQSKYKSKIESLIWEHTTPAPLMSHVKHIFAENDVTGKILAYMTRQELIDMEIDDTDLIDFLVTELVKWQN